MKGKRRNINRLTVSRSLEGRSFYEKCENPRHTTVHTSDTNNVDIIQIILFLTWYHFRFISRSYCYCVRKTKRREEETHPSSRCRCRCLCQYQRECWTDNKHGLVCGCVRLLIASSPAADWDQLISPLQTPSSPQPSSSTTHNQHHAPPAFLQRKKFWPPNGCLHDKNRWWI